MNRSEAKQLWADHRAEHAKRGVILPFVQSYLPDEFKQDFNLAMDAMPELTTAPNSGIPAFLTMFQDPGVIRILFAANKASEIFGEVRKGTWLDETAMFTVVEHTGEVSSYDDWSESGSAGLNSNFPWRQSYLFQTLKQYGDRQLERAGLAKLNFVSEVDQAAGTVMAKFLNVSYFYGILGLKCYGFFNDPDLSPALTPATKAKGGTTWFKNGRPNASANEVYDDIVALFEQLVVQTAGLGVEKEDKLTLGLDPSNAVALTFTNSFGVNVEDLLKKNFPKLTIKTAVQYGKKSAINPQGVAGGNFMQMFVDAVEGQDVGFCAFNEKMRAHPIIRGVSSYKQKITGGTWGAVVKFPAGVSSMIGT